MKRFIPTLAVIAALAVPATSFAADGEGRQLAELAYSSVDSSDRGYIGLGEFWSFGTDVFTSMDSDDDEKLSLGEFMSWDYGMRPLAQEAGREDAYDTALRVVFAFWDRNGDGEVSKSEHRKSLYHDFARADDDSNALLTKEEFTSGFSVMIALKAAINPTPIQE